MLIKKIIKNLKKENKKIVLAHGTFDLLHVGHIKHLKQAKKFGDYLIVSITSSKFVNKGAGRPIFNDHQRLTAINSLKFVDYALISFEKTAIHSLRLVKPDYYVKGFEYKNSENDLTNNISKEEKVVNEFGGKLVFTNEEVFSSTNLINNNSNIYNKEFIKKVKCIKKFQTLKKIIKLENKIKKLKILLIGDTIIDRYKFVSALNKSNKENIISYKTEYKNDFCGGVLAAGNTLSSFVNKLDIVTAYGGENFIKKLIKDKMQKNIKIYNFKQKNYSPIIKTRFIEKNTNVKNYQTYDMKKNNNIKLINKKIYEFLKKNIKNYDMVITTDFGHKLIDNNIVKILQEKSKYLCVNCQSNSANQGFNLITKYKKINYGSIDLYEAKLASNNIDLMPEKFQKVIDKKLKFDIFSITLGKRGSIILKNSKSYHLEALQNNAIDTMGAGDAYFVISSLFAYLNFKIEEISILGNCAASIKIAHVGHDHIINKKEIVKCLEIFNK
jgi:rfaE bifunctional protein nucleotidyltransferase chain/domain